MRRVVLLTLGLWLSCSPAFAQVTGKGVSTAPLPADPLETRTKRLDFLFARLKEAQSDQVAQPVEAQISKILAESGSDTADLLMSRAVAAEAAKQTDLALALIDSLLSLNPDYAEGYYRRAALLYSRDEYGPALAALESALLHEPRHIEALAAMGSVLNAAGQKKAALLALRRVQELSPFHDNLSERIRTLTLEVEGRGI
jgi:tetratricopeptide (TPR) repeat protein